MAAIKKIMSNRKITLLAVLVALVVILVAGLQVTKANQQRNAYQQASAEANLLKMEQVSFAQELEAELMSVNTAKASNLSATYKEEFEAAKARKQQQASGGGQAYTQPALGTFRADAYGYTGADQLAYWTSINSDVVGWLRVPGTNINHAVVQNTQDVNYYTARGYDRNYSYYGVIWTNPDTRTGSSGNISSNTVMYGHNWSNYGGSPRIGYSGDIMFGQLTGYHWLSMAQSYPYIYYSTHSEQMTFVIFACFYTELAFQYNSTEGNMSYIIQEAQTRSRHNFGVDVNSSDKVITLSTCTRAYGATNNQRFVVMARLLRPGETIGPVTVTANPGHKQPYVW